jgi:hypothetical protein
VGHNSYWFACLYTLDEPLNIGSNEFLLHTPSLPKRTHCDAGGALDTPAREAART